MGGNPTQDVYAYIEVEGYGTIKIHLAPREAPETVRNFVKYAQDHFYDGLIFHRVIENFMIQGGGFYPDMTQKQPTYPPIVNEASKAELRNLRGTIAMARTSDPNSATSQFYINQVDNPGLDWDKAQDGYGYCVFGHVVEGMDIVDAIASVETGEQNGYSDVPLEPVVMTSVTVEWTG
ncbi:MAG: peptidylprolyl isomerase [Thermoplasmata archaeon]|nr:peptidylprolyl isomerase [Thermoplasmata archaeon]